VDQVNFVSPVEKLLGQIGYVSADAGSRALHELQYSEVPGGDRLRIGRRVHWWGRTGSVSDREGLEHNACGMHDVEWLDERRTCAAEFVSQCGIVDEG
jgi:hypothetical protein